MKPELSHGKVIDHSHGLGTVTEEMVRERAREIAETNGRRPEEANASDFDQARTELQGRSVQTNEMDEDYREFDDVPGQSGRRAVTQSADDEQTMAEELVDEGLEEAEHERMVEGSRESRERDER